MQELQLAYIDPGSGSFLVQALVATAAGLAVAARRYGSRIRRFFGAARPEPPPDERDERSGKNGERSGKRDERGPDGSP